MAVYSPYENSKIYGSELNTNTFVIDNLILYMNYLDIAQLPTGYILDDYRDYFEPYLVETDVPESLFYRPTAFAKLIYGSPELEFLILYFAKISSVLDFNRSKIKILPPERLGDINAIILQFADKVALNKTDPPTYIL